MGSDVKRRALRGRVALASELQTIQDYQNGDSQGGKQA